MTAEERIQYIEKQIRAVKEGRQNLVNCPYCDSQNREGDPFCCKTFAAAVLAILDRGDSQELIDHAARVADKAGLN